MSIQTNFQPSWNPEVASLWKLPPLEEVLALYPMYFDELITIDQAAAFLGEHPKTTYSRCKREQLPHIRLPHVDGDGEKPGVLRTTRRALIEWLQLDDPKSTRAVARLTDQMDDRLVALGLLEPAENEA